MVQPKGLRPAWPLCRDLALFVTFLSIEKEYKELFKACTETQFPYKNPHKMNHINLVLYYVPLHTGSSFSF